MSPAARLLRFFVRGYQLLFSSFMGRSCRYYPTCSSYMSESLRRHGAIKGGFLGLWRIARCHPFNRGGYDPVPESFDNPLHALKKRCGCASRYDKQALDPANKSDMT